MRTMFLPRSLAADRDTRSTGMTVTSDCGQLFVQGRRNARADQFDGAHQRRVRQRRHVHLERDPRDTAQRLAVPNGSSRPPPRGCRSATRRRDRAARRSPHGSPAASPALSRRRSRRERSPERTRRRLPASSRRRSRARGRRPSADPVSVRTGRLFRDTDQSAGRNRRGSPPMIATINGSPSAPARTNDCGVPPTPSQIGNGFCTGLG